MRGTLFVIAFLSSFCCFSQVNEDFSDGDFTQNPVWAGAMDKFAVNTKKELRLNDTGSEGGYADLFTKSSVLRGTTWEFYVHLLFNPSVNNYAIFYLASMDSNLSETTDGYFIMIGGETDCVSLCRMDKGESETLLAGRLVMKGISSPQLKVKVQCDKTGNWTLQTCLLNNETDYTQEGSVQDTRYSTAAYVGIGCVYTASRSKSFAFDDIFVSADEGIPDEPDTPDEPDIPVTDTAPPKISSLIANLDTVIQIRFDEAIDIEKAIFYIDARHTVKKKTLSKDKKQLDLLLFAPLENNQEYMLTINGVRDVSGNIMPMCSVGFKFYDISMQTVAFGDVVFNEIMANPKGVTLLPESEYIEFFNRLDFPINLKGWKLHYGEKPYVLPEMVIAPLGYIVLCHEKYMQAWKDRGIEVIDLPSFPVLANSGKLLYLEDSRDKLVSWIDYSDSWYKDDLKKEGGFSLECLDTDNISGNPDNWKATADERGGTPGEENSVKCNFPDETYAEISHFYMETPDTLVVSFTKPMNLRTLSILENFSIKGIDNSVQAVTSGYPECKSVALTLSSALSPGEEIEVDLSGLKDISGYEMEGTLSFKIGLPVAPDKGDVVFNEVLFNPLPGENDYIELYNNSDKYISLSALGFSSIKQDGSFTEVVPLASDKRIFSPGTYLCFAKKQEILCAHYMCCKNRLMDIGSLPSMPDDKGTILLLASAGELLDKLSYAEKMHSALLDNKEGIALEKTHPEQNSGLSSNWLSASTVSGGGTPGCPNSQYREQSVGGDEEFRLETESFSPDGDGVDDELLISYHLDGEHFQANLKVFDVSGRLINNVAENFRLEQSGCFVWDGKDKNGRMAPVGLYIIYIEAYNPAGEIKHFKLACALTR